MSLRAVLSFLFGWAGAGGDSLTKNNNFHFLAFFMLTNIMVTFVILVCIEFFLEMFRKSITLNYIFYVTYLRFIFVGGRGYQDNLAFRKGHKSVFECPK